MLICKYEHICDSTVKIYMSTIFSSKYLRILRCGAIRFLSMSLHLHVLSGQFTILLPNPEEEVYRVDQIKEFEYISQIYKDWIGEVLERGKIYCLKLIICCII